MFHVIEFTYINEVAVAPSNWIKGGICLWPPVKTPSKLAKMVKNREMPGENWQEYQIRTMGEFATYEEARKRLKKAEDTSDLQTDIEKSRKRTKKRCFSESNSSDEGSLSLLPQAPPIPKKSKLSDIFNSTSYIHTPHLYSAPSTSDFRSTPNRSHTSTLFRQQPHTSEPHLYSASSDFHSTPNHTPTLFRQQPHTSEPHSYSAPTSDFHNTSIHSHIPTHTQLSLNTTYLEQPSPSQLNPTNETQQSCSCSKLSLQILKSIQKELIAHTQILENHSQTLTKILNLHQNPSAGISQSVPSSLPIRLPLKNIEEIKMLEDFLKDEANFSQLVSYFASFGGEGNKKILQRLLPNIFSHELSGMINWKGRNCKHQFEQYSRIQGVIYHAVKLNTKENITLDVVEKFLKDWFRFSGDRNGGRNKRKNLL